MNDIQNKVAAARQQLQELEQELRGYINNAKDGNCLLFLISKLSSFCAIY